MITLILNDSGRFKKRSKKRSRVFARSLHVAQRKYFKIRYALLQVILPQIEPVYGIVLKGSPLYDQYVTSYHVLHSTDGLRFDYIPESIDTPKLFRGNIEPRKPMKQMFDYPIEMKALRISPQSWHDSIALQLEIIGCGEPLTTGIEKTTIKPICVDKMGVDNGKMQNDQIKVSSEKIPGAKSGLKLSSKDAWKPLTNSPTEWVQFDFLEPRNVTGIETKGGPNGWVSAYGVEYSHDNKIWNPILDDYSNEKLFLGNFDHDTPHRNYFERPLQTQYVRVEPKKWKDNIEMRIEPLGCFQAYPKLAKPPKVPMVRSMCPNCPDVPREAARKEGCRCDLPLFWDGR